MFALYTRNCVHVFADEKETFGNHLQLLMKFLLQSLMTLGHNYYYI